VTTKYTTGLSKNFAALDALNTITKHDLCLLEVGRHYINLRSGFSVSAKQIKSQASV